MWISPDPARQHHSPYTYGSNNPVNRVDPDGNQDGSIKSMFRWALNYSGPNEIPIDQKQLADKSAFGAEAVSYAAMACDVGSLVSPEPASKVALGASGLGLGALSASMQWGAFVLDPTFERFGDAVINTAFLGIGYAAGAIVSKSEYQVLKNGNAVFRNTDNGRFVAKASGMNDLYKSAGAGVAVDATSVLIDENR